MRNLSVRDLMAYSQTPPSVVRADATLREVAAQLIADRSTREVYLVDEAGRYFGVITVRRLARFVFTHHVPDQSSTTELLDLVSARNAGDLAIRKPVCVGEDDSVEQLLGVMFRFEVDEIPVVDAQRVVVGKIGMLELIAAWHAGALDGSEGDGDGMGPR
jgi:CBS domain-containing protein